MTFDIVTVGESMEIKRVGSQPSARGPSEWFSGTVRIDPIPHLFQVPALRLSRVRELHGIRIRSVKL
jgi:hypothetical protein